MKLQIHIYIFLVLVSLGNKTVAQTFEVDGINYNITGTNQVQVTSKTGCYTGDIVIPSSVEESGVTYNVTAIGVNAFYQCSGLNSINLPSSVTEIKAQAFLECTNLVSINLTNSISSIGSYAFRSCTSLTAVDLSATTITTIREYTFLRCENVASFILPDSLESIENNAFHYCESLTQIDIPDTVTSIGIRAFAYSGLTSIDIPNEIPIISNYAFEVCRDMKTVNVPSSVTSIGDYAFYGNYTLETFNIDIAVPLAISSTVFEGRNLSLVTLNVPTGSESAYTGTAIWQNFGTINGTLNTDDLEKESAIRLYPNPANDYVFISGLKHPENYSIYNVVGKHITSGVVTNRNSIGINDLVNGFYFLKFETSQTIRFVKQ